MEYRMRRLYIGDLNMTWINGTMSGHIRYTVITYWPVSHTDLHNDPPDGEQLVGSHSRSSTTKFEIAIGRYR